MKHRLDTPNVQPFPQMVHLACTHLENLYVHFISAKNSGNATPSSCDTLLELPFSSCFCQSNKSPSLQNQNLIPVNTLLLLVSNIMHNVTWKTNNRTWKGLQSQLLCLWNFGNPYSQRYCPDLYLHYSSMGCRTSIFEKINSALEDELIHMSRNCVFTTPSSLSNTRTMRGLFFLGH